jgi:hypothetical protein
MTPETPGTPVTVGRFEQQAADYDREVCRRRYLADPWSWICETVSTIDELDAARPVKPFPVSACAPCKRYLGHAERERCPQCGGAPKPLSYLKVPHGGVAPGGSADPHHPEGTEDAPLVDGVRLAHVAGTLSAAQQGLPHL